MEKEIIHEFFFAHAPADVWLYLTDADLLAQWLMPNDFKPELNRKFQFKTKPRIPIGFDGIVYCQVLEIIPGKKLVYSWQGGMSKENPSLDSIVTWTLTPKANGTILRLEHTGFRGVKNYFSYLIMNKGWLKIGRRLISRLDTAAVTNN
ncbi:SRPBCC domain-containing protein [Mucilaginibacter sp. 14171R-50]|uniref:SRPBCC family protein n=1 Tax=Mucilaginibacter sp. 14171R-50 TaxID=2703789 RepID=UPI00138DC6FE|nr:SRPBCC domain-containing protein [Mucilaginibacter sp. 14171R-50]QHS55633.1 SRPBCC domain-containing protein [Mucilaginibacter sp. 14171R-50]